MTVDEFDIICDKFTNKDIFLCNNEGKLIKDENNSLIKNMIIKFCEENILIIDIPTSNVGSIKNVIAELGFHVKVSSNLEDIKKSKKLYYLGMVPFQQKSSLRKKIFLSI